MTHTLVQPSENEATEVDVGEPVQHLERPAHLRDHAYSIYNPQEGENIALGAQRSIRVTSTIPPIRLSYAPQVPDSPTTLYKLLKVVSKKSGGRGGRTSTPVGGVAKGNRARSGTPTG